tara:strand:+ start:411 stop:839 length:429 start_codon:yes stop_codon:yes gene_type:complete
MKAFIVSICFVLIAVVLYANNQSQYGGAARVHQCIGQCYAEYTKLNGSPAEIEKQKRLLAANSSPAELGAKLYSGCAACHGGNGEGGVGPALVGQTSEEIISKLVAYKNGETRGAQSVLMWGQSAGLSDADMQNLAAYIITF